MRKLSWIEFIFTPLAVLKAALWVWDTAYYLTTRGGIRKSDLRLIEFAGIKIEEP